MFDYQTKGCSKYGAQMGRGSDLPRDTDTKCLIRAVPLTDGYDPGGAYWGSPNDLYYVESLDTGQSAYLRAQSEKAAREAFPRATWDDSASESDAADFLQAYITAALWSSTDSDGSPIDSNYSESDLAPEALGKMRADCDKFLAKASRLVGAHASQAGHDFWMTRTRSGVGFEDRDCYASPKVARALGDFARSFGEAYITIGDDGKIYQD